MLLPTALLLLHACLLQPLSSNGYCIASYFMVMDPLPSICHTAPSLRLSYRHFFFTKSCVCNVCDQPSLPSPWLGFHNDYSATASAATSLRPNFPTGSLKRCEPVQVYHHHPQSRVLPNPVNHIVSQCDYLVRALPWGLKLGRLSFHVGGLIQPHVNPLVVACVVGQSVVMSFHPGTGQLQVLAGITVDVM
jgi:hypothetical protein